MSVAERKKGGGPTGTRLESMEKRRRIVDLRKQSWSYDAIGDELGLSHEGVRYHVLAWLAEITPSAEATEELRQTQLASIEGMERKLWPRLESDDYLSVVDRIVKLMDRKARLMGLDLERNINVNVLPTAEQFAAFLEWDAPAAAIEGTATEITDGAADA